MCAARGDSGSGVEAQPFRGPNANKYDAIRRAPHLAREADASELPDP